MARPNFRVTKTDGDTGKKTTLSRTGTADKAVDRRQQEVEWNRTQRRGSSDSFGVQEIQHRR
jgi:hypothetical protein